MAKATEASMIGSDIFAAKIKTLAEMIGKLPESGAVEIDQLVPVIGTMLDVINAANGMTLCLTTALNALLTENERLQVIIKARGSAASFQTH